LETDLQEFFQTKLQEYNDPLLNSVFETHVLTPMKTSMVFNGRTKARNRIMAKFGFESAGILPWTYNNIFNNNSSGFGSDQDNFKISGIPFFQYIRTDFEFSFQQMFFGQKNSINARLDLGLGIPYGNSQLMPFEKLYYVGGANSMRAWPLRGLGPGSYYDSSDIRFNQSGNLKFETNFEYRFNMVSILKGAFFVDIGNVWTNSEDENRPGSEFYIENFFKELAVGTGFGIRWDFTFFILRTDFAIPVREPSMPEGNRWVLKQSKLEDVNVTIGIGYPF
jgi:outer membrane protein assembly factor BamA